jgi:hypothetical protein
MRVIISNIRFFSKIQSSERIIFFYLKISSNSNSKTKKNGTPKIENAQKVGHYHQSSTTILPSEKSTFIQERLAIWQPSNSPKKERFHTALTEIPAPGVFSKWFSTQKTTMKTAFLFCEFVRTSRWRSDENIVFYNLKNVQKTQLLVIDDECGNRWEASDSFFVNTIPQVVADVKCLTLAGKMTIS